MGPNSEPETQLHQEGLGWQLCDVNKAVYSSGNKFRQSQEALPPPEGL